MEDYVAVAVLLIIGVLVLSLLIGGDGSVLGLSKEAGRDVVTELIDSF